MPSFDPGTGKHIVIDGMIVERDASGIRERIHEYDEDLEVMCLDPARTDAINDAPFVLIWKRPSGDYVRVFEFWELNQTVLDRIYASDQHHFDAISRVESMESVQAKIKADRYKDKVGETADMLGHAMRASGTSYTIKNHEGEKVKINDTGLPTRNDNKFFSFGSK